MPGALDKIVTHELALRRQSAEAKARKAPAEEARRRRDRFETYLRARREASGAARHLTGRVLFPARWDVTEGNHGWLALTAKFDGKIDLRYFWHPFTEKINTMKVRPLRLRDGFERWPEITDPSRPRLVEALLTWGLA